MWIPLLLALPVHAATADQVAAALATFNQHATIPLPPLSERELEKLAKGDIVRNVDREQTDDGPARAIGMVVLDAGRPAVWLSMQDPHYAGTDGLIEARLKTDGRDRERWFGYLDVPRPFPDRQWVIDVWNEHGVAAATGGVAWEHPWALTPDGMAQVRPKVAAGEVAGLTVDDLDGAITTPLNQGAWVALDLGPDQTLLIYHCRFDVGGRVPDGLMTQYILSTFPKVFRAIEARAQDQVPGHYVAGHKAVYGGDGKEIARFGSPASAGAPPAAAD